MFSSILKVEKIQNNRFEYSRDLFDMLSLGNVIYSRNINFMDYISTDVEIINSRNMVISDVVRIKGLYDIFNELINKLEYISNIINIKDKNYASETHLFSLKQLKIYFDCIDLVIAGKDSFLQADSDGIRELFEYVEETATSSEYRYLVKGTEKLIEEISNIKSITVGFNFNEDLSLKESGIISINPQQITGMTLTEKMIASGAEKDNRYSSIAPLTSFKILKKHEHEMLNTNFYIALNKWFRKNISQWQPAVDTFLKEKCRVMINLLPELIFITESVRIQNMLRDMGMDLCKPVMKDMESKTFTVKGLYNPVLALSLGKDKTIPNDISFDEKGMIYIITGPNQGGKSVFTYAIGIAQLFAQLGWLVPAKYACISPVSGIFTHFPITATQASTTNKGRLGEECERLSEIMDKIDGHSLILFDETLSSTDAAEAVFIAGDVIKAISTYGARCVYSTHLHEIVRITDEINLIPECISKVDYLKVCIDGSMRTYKIIREKSDGKSYANDIAKKYGLVYDMIKKA